MCPLLADCCDHFTGLLICARHILVEVWFYFCFLWVSGLLLGLWVYDKPAVATLGVLVALAATFDTPPPRAVVDGEGLQFRKKKTPVRVELQPSPCAAGSSVSYTRCCCTPIEFQLCVRARFWITDHDYRTRREPPLRNVCRVQSNLPPSGLDEGTDLLNRKIEAGRVK